jgi:hypothetical protein
MAFTVVVLLCCKHRKRRTRGVRGGNAPEYLWALNTNTQWPATSDLFSSSR